MAATNVSSYDSRLLAAMIWMRDNNKERLDREPHDEAIRRVNHIILKGEHSDGRINLS